MKRTYPFIEAYKNAPKKMTSAQNMRLTGNRVMLLRIETEAIKEGHIFLVDTYKKGSVMFQVLAVGPGRWIKRGKKYVWIKPEVKPGDVVGSHHAINATEHPNYHPPHHLDSADGVGRVVLDARFCECIFKQ